MISGYFTSFLEFFPQHQTSPELMKTGKGLYLKPLLPGSFVQVFEINRNFRHKGLFIQHNP